MRWPETGSLLPDKGQKKAAYGHPIRLSRDLLRLNYSTRARLHVPPLPWRHRIGVGQAGTSRPRIQFGGRIPLAHLGRLLLRILLVMPCQTRRELRQSGIQRLRAMQNIFD